MGDIAQTMKAAKTDAVKALGLDGIGGGNAVSGLPNPGGAPVSIPGLPDVGGTPLDALLAMSMGQDGGGSVDNSSQGVIQNPIMEALTDVPVPQGVNPNPSQDPRLYDNPYTPYDNTGPQGEPVVGDKEPIEVTGDSWKPKSPGWLGDVIDTLRAVKGKPPTFRLRKNLPEALEGFQSDPERAIRRVSKIDPQMAWRMYEDYSRTRANSALEQKRTTDRITKGGDAIASMLGAVQQAPNPEAAYAKAYPTLSRYAKQLHYPEDMLPQQYDATTINTLRKGGLSVYQDETLQRMERQFQHDSTMDERKLQDLSGHRAASREETRRYHDETLTIDRAAEGRKGAVSRNIFYQDGSFGGVLSPDGRGAAIQGRDGNWYAYRLRKPGDINSRVRSPGEDKAVREAYGASTEGK